MPGHIRRSGLILLAITVASGSLVAAGIQAVGTPAAGADQIGNDQAQAQALQSQIAANNEKIDALGQQADGAEIRLQQAQQNLVTTQAHLATTQSALARIRVQVQERAVAAYQGAISGEQFEGLDVGDAQRLLIAQKYTATEAAQDEALFQSLNATEQQLSQQKAAAEKATAQADADNKQIQSTRASLQTVTAQQQQTLGQVQGQLITLVQQQQAQADAENLASSINEFGGSDGGDPSAYPNLPPVSPQAAQALAYARAQLGKSYVYAAAGPDHFDCSGLVMAAYASAGVQLPHYSGAQYAMLPHIPFSQLQPGDLLFWGVNASEHVAFYVGDGKLLESGGDTNEVHIGPIWGSPTGAARVL
jgi:cell wall-associated NlpC family hydrolase